MFIVSHLGSHAANTQDIFFKIGNYNNKKKKKNTLRCHKVFFHRVRQISQHVNSVFKILINLLIIPALTDMQKIEKQMFYMKILLKLALGLKLVWLK